MSSVNASAIILYLLDMFHVLGSFQLVLCGTADAACKGVSRLRNGAV